MKNVTWIYLNDTWKNEHPRAQNAWCNWVMNKFDLHYGDEIDHGKVYALCDRDNHCDQLVAKVERGWALTDRIRREVKAQRKIADQGYAPRVYAAWICNRLFFSQSHIVMDRVSGQTLYHLIKRDVRTILEKKLDEADDYYLTYRQHQPISFSDYQRQVRFGLVPPIDQIMTTYGPWIQAAVDVLTSNGVNHNNLKTKNLIINDSQVMIIEFGFATMDGPNNDRAMIIEDVIRVCALTTYQFSKNPENISEDYIRTRTQL